MYEIKTHCGYPIKVTDCHSIYIYEGGKVKTKKASQVQRGDLLLFPRKFPVQNKEAIIDLRQTLLREKSKNVSLKVKKNEVKNIPSSAWIEISSDIFQELKQERVSAGISRVKMEGLAGLGRGVVQQWEERFDNVMPRFSYFERYLGQINQGIDGIDYNLYIPIEDWQNRSFPENADFYYGNHTRTLKTQFKLDEDLAYFMGWFLGDGYAAPEKNNPNRFSLALGKDKVENYLPSLSKIIREKFGRQPIIEKRKIGDTLLTFHSFEFKLILKELGLLGKKCNEKFVPEVFFNVKKEIQEALLKGLLQSDGFITVWQSPKNNRITARYGWKLSSPELIQGILTIFRQLGMFAGYSVVEPKHHVRNGKIFRSNFKSYCATISIIDYFLQTKNIWQEHKSASKLEEYVKNADMVRARGKQTKVISNDFVGLEVKAVKQIKNPKDKFVYDFSVLGNQNFIAGKGGCLLHNTDGAHIRTLLLTLFYRYFKPLIDGGYLYIAQPPLYKIQAGKRVEYAYLESDKKEILEDMRKSELKNINIQRYKGLGEMNADELWSTTMDPENRILLQVKIEDAKEADKIFDILMGKEVPARKRFIQAHAKTVKNLDI